jgi:tripartite-type tricarboxylate transporter receptor subunit TctC
MITKRAFLSTVAMAGTAAGFGIAGRWPAFAQPYPSGVIRIVVPYSASTPPDILARIVATALAEGEGWNVIVENKPGAVMTTGTSEVLRQPADGHTLLSITAPFAAVPALVPDAKFKGSGRHSSESRPPTAGRKILFRCNFRRSKLRS